MLPSPFILHPSSFTLHLLHLTPSCTTNSVTLRPLPFTSFTSSFTVHHAYGVLVSEICYLLHPFIFTLHLSFTIHLLHPSSPSSFTLHLCVFLILFFRVATVVAYFEKWMKKWPTIKALSEATQEVSSFVIHPSSFILHHSSFILHPSPSSFTFCYSPKEGSI